MATSVKVTNKMPEFERTANRVIIDALNEIGRDILIDAKNTAPFEKGGLRSNSRVEKKGELSRSVLFDIEYARFQEFGGDNKRRVQKYSEAGTGKHFLKNAGEKQKERFTAKIKKHTSRIKV